jgi:galactokinase
VALVATDAAAAVMAELRRRYRDAKGIDAGMFVTRAADGARVTTD